MPIFNLYPVLAIVGGGLLAWMIHLNSQLAAESSALNASWIAHGLGAGVAWLLVLIFRSGTIRQSHDPEPSVSKLFYLGGLPGAMTVILASLVVNSRVGLAGTLALALTGQLACSLVCEHYGLFKLKQIALSLADLVPVLLVLLGALLLIYVRH